MSTRLTRRHFLGAATAVGAGLTIRGTSAAADKPALLGGKPVRQGAFPSWPRSDRLDEEALLGVLRSGRWYRGGAPMVDRFEAAYAELTGAKHCVATANGTSALFCSLSALGVGPGDEVIVAPYTFVATLNVILLQYAMPIFVDTDYETHMIDPRKIEAAITPRTAAILPVHIGGSVADMDGILAVARKHKIPVVEDACQAHLAEWRGKKVGTWGTTGCFSFQVSKNLCCGEGGAILTNDPDVAQKCYSFHDNSRTRPTPGCGPYKPHGRSTNVRLTEFQAALLLAQMTRVEEQSRTRAENAQYLTSMLREIPGLAPARMYEGCTRNAYHLYMYRYDKERFAGLARAKFLQAMRAEGIPTSSGYGPLNKDPLIKSAFAARAFQKVFSADDLARWDERNQCPENDRLCTDGAWMSQTMFLGPRSDMDQIAEAARKIHAHAADLVKA